MYCVQTRVKVRVLLPVMVLPDYRLLFWRSAVYFHFCYWNRLSAGVVFVFIFPSAHGCHTIRDELKFLSCTMGAHTVFWMTVRFSETPSEHFRSSFPIGSLLLPKKLHFYCCQIDWFVCTSTFVTHNLAFESVSQETFICSHPTPIRYALCDFGWKLTFALSVWKLRAGPVLTAARSVQLTYHMSIIMSNFTVITNIICMLITWILVQNTKTCFIWTGVSSCFH